MRSTFTALSSRIARVARKLRRKRPLSIAAAWPEVHVDPAAGNQMWWSELPTVHDEITPVSSRLAFARPAALAAVTDGPSLATAATDDFGLRTACDLAYDPEYIDRFDKAPGFLLVVEVNGSATLRADCLVSDSCRPVALRLPPGFPRPVAERAVNGTVDIVTAAEFSASQWAAPTRRIDLDSRLTAAMRLLRHASGRRTFPDGARTQAEASAHPSRLEEGRFLRLALEVWVNEGRGEPEQIPAAIIGACWGIRHWNDADQIPSDDQIRFYARSELRG